MSALLCGYIKSGNSLLYKLLRELYDFEFTSYSKSFGLSSLIEKLCYGYLSFPLVAEYDNLRVGPYGVLELEFPHPLCRRVSIFQEHLISSTILWTHERPDRLKMTLLEKFPHKRLYLLRDGRDVITSQVHYVVTGLSRRLRPEYEYETAAEVYADRTLFERWSREWANHVLAYLEDEERYHLVRFEELTDREKLPRIIRELAALLDIALPKGERKYYGKDPEAVEEIRINEIIEAISFEKMKAEAPDHLRRDDSGGWREEWTEEHIRIFDKAAGEVLEEVGYRNGYLEEE